MRADSSMCEIIDHGRTTDDLPVQLSETDVPAPRTVSRPRSASASSGGGDTARAAGRQKASMGCRPATSSRELRIDMALVIDEAELLSGEGRCWRWQVVRW